MSATAKAGSLGRGRRAFGDEKCTAHRRQGQAGASEQLASLVCADAPSAAPSEGRSPSRQCRRNTKGGGSPLAAAPAAASAPCRSALTAKPISFFDTMENACNPASPAAAGEAKTHTSRGRDRARKTASAASIIESAPGTRNPPISAAAQGSLNAQDPEACLAGSGIAGTSAAVMNLSTMKRQQTPTHEAESDNGGLAGSSSESEFVRAFMTRSKPRAPSKRTKPHAFSKRARLTPKKHSGLLPDHAMHAIIEFVPDAQSLYSFALSCKDFGRHIMKLPLSHPLLLPGAERLSHPLHNNLITLCVIASDFVCTLCGEKKVKTIKEPWNVWAHDICVRDQLANKYYISNGDEATRMVALGKAYRKPGVISLTAVAKAGLPFQEIPGYNRNAACGYRDWTAEYYWANKSPQLPSTWTLEGFLQQGWREPRDDAVMRAHAQQVEQTRREWEGVAKYVALERKRWAIRLQSRHAVERVDATAARLAKLDSHLDAEGLGSVEQLRIRWSPSEIEEVLGEFLLERKTAPYSYLEAVRRVKHHEASRQQRIQ